MLEAYRNKDIKPVPVKNIEQQSITALHRVRSTWVASRTARINTLRGLLRELGIFIPVGASKVVPVVLELIEDADSALPDALRQCFHEVCLEIRDYEKRISGIEGQLRALSKQMPTVVLLLTIPGIGLLTATALVALVGDIQRFRSARHSASFLGLTPRLRGSGLSLHLGRISKQGDRYLRALLTHGARSVLLRAGRMEKPDRLRAWALRVYSRRGHNKATIAIANKLARTVWAVWKHNTEFKSYPKAA